MDRPSPYIQLQASSRSSVSSIRTTSTRTLRLTSPAPSTLALPTVTSVSASSASSLPSPSSVVPMAEDSQTSSFFMRSALQKDNDIIQARQAELEKNRIRGSGKGKGKGRDRTWITSEFGGEGGGEAAMFLGKRRLIENPLEEVLHGQDQDGASASASISTPPPPSSLPTTPLSVSPSIALPSDASQEKESNPYPIQAMDSSANLSVPARQHSWFSWPSSQNISSSGPVCVSIDSDMTGKEPLALPSSPSTLVPSTASASSRPSIIPQIETSDNSNMSLESAPITKPGQPTNQQASVEIANSLAWLRPSRLSQFQVSSGLVSVSSKENARHPQPESYRGPTDNLLADVETNVSSKPDATAEQEKKPSPLIVEVNSPKGRWLWPYRDEPVHQPSSLPNVQLPDVSLQPSKHSDIKFTETVVSEDVNQNNSSQNASLPTSEAKYSEWWSYLGYGSTRSTPALPRGEDKLPDVTTEQPAAVVEGNAEASETNQPTSHSTTDSLPEVPPDVLASAVFSKSSYLNPVSWFWPLATPEPVSVPTSIPTVPSDDISSPNFKISTPATLSPPIPSTPPTTTKLPVPPLSQPDTSPVSPAVPISASYSSWLSTLTPVQFRVKESVPSSSSSSIIDGQKILATGGKEDTLSCDTTELPQVLAVSNPGTHAEPSLDERKDTRQKSSLGMLASKLRLSSSNLNLASSVPSSDPSADTIGITTSRPRKLSSERPISLANEPRRQSILVSLPPPNLVLPTFSDIFDRSPRSDPPRTLPGQSSLDPVSNSTGRIKKRTMAKSAISSLTAYVYGQKNTNGSEDVDMNQGERTSTGRSDRQHPEDPELRELPKTLVVQRGLKGGSEEGKALGVEGVKRIVVIGVHGWFPNAIVRYIAGEPTGTSVAFTKKMVKMAESYFGEETLEKITAMPLEGEGKVEHRVDRLFKEFTSNPDWVDDLRSADAILIATHSQGCPVSTYLIERLYAQGHIRSAFNQLAVEELKQQLGPAKGEQENKKLPKVLMLGLCGVHLGPLAYLSSSSVVMPYIQYFENAAAHQLFEFQDTESATSKSYTQSLSNVLDQGCKFVYVASLNDQVVPVYSAIFSVAHHPNILRVLHIDGVAYDVSDFVTKLLTFCLQLHNAGLSDGGLVAHLSEAVAAGLTGIGHSTAYGEDSTYLLAIRYLFETTSSSVPAGSLEVDEFLASEERNGYEIPWILRGIMEDPSVLRYFGRELDELRNSFDHWNPKAAKMKDLRRKLEPLRPRKTRRGNGQVGPISTPESNVPTAPLVLPIIKPTDSSPVEIVQNPTNPLTSVPLIQDW